MGIDIKNNIFKVSYESKLISRGNNFPTINMQKGSLDLICVLLHKKTRLNDIQEVLSMSEETLDTSLEILLNEGLIKKEKGAYLPTFMILSEEEGAWLKKISLNIGDEIFKIILYSMERIIDETVNIKAFNSFTFDELSLFILSDVILDFIQIDNVENLFIKANRPSRNNKNYYFSIMEKAKNSPKEAFGIYGNHFENIGDLSFGMYGNERYSIPNFITLTDLQGREFFGDKYIGIKNFKSALLEKIISFNKGKIMLDKNIQFGLEKLNIMHNGVLKIPILDQVDYHALYNIADVIKDGLIDILESNRSYLLNEYCNNHYKEETSFEEFFIWYYHILYSHVTEELIENQIVKKPKEGIFNYILE
ncbi:hypothetical protein ACLM5H_05610 [Fredinandcohnia humi]